VDGQQATGSVGLGTGDYFDFGDRRYTVQEDIGQLRAARLGKSDLIAIDLWARSKFKTRLSDMSFVQRERTVLAVLGPSGAGKTSTFLALLGELPLQSGRLYFRGLPMATHARQIREHLGFVPQQTELHPTLTVEATLGYGFGLRSPAGKASREAAVDRAIDAVKLQEQRGQLLATLSGGQLRRVSIALELLTEPSLLMLDEPTSGLDANMDREIMTFLREYAEHVDPAHPERSRTVVVITHATEHLHLAHEILVVVKGGAPAYSGPPRQIRKHFGFRTYAELMALLLEEPEKWASTYHDGRQRQEALREADQVEAAIAADPAGHGRGWRSALRRRSPRARFQQFGVLIRRQCALLSSRALKDDDPSPVAQLRNWAVVALPLIVAALAAGLAAMVAASPGLGRGPAATTALTLLSTLGILTGQALTYSDVVNEMPIIRREARGGVGAFPVLATKWLVFSVLAIGQAAVITAVFCAVPHRSPQEGLIVGPVPDVFLGLAALSVTAMSLGLLISVLSAKLEHAVALVTAVSITQIALNGLTSNLSHLSAVSAFAALFPDRWGVAALASSIDLRGFDGRLVSHDPVWTHSAAHWGADIGVLGLLSAAYFAVAVYLLSSKLRLKA
jgi:ABC-type multidrug transport system ATPase subunit